MGDLASSALEMTIWPKTPGGATLRSGRIIASARGQAITLASVGATLVWTILAWNLSPSTRSASGTTWSLMIQLMTVARDWNDDPAQALCLEYQIWVQTREQGLFTCHRNIAPVATTTDGPRIGISTCESGSHVTLRSLWDVIDGGERTAIRIHLQ